MATTADASVLSSWIQIKPDSTIALRVGVGEIGQGAVSTGLRQIVAEELRIPFESITDVVTGDTDVTPDGGISAAVLNRSVHIRMMGKDGVHPDSPFGRNALNLQKVAAYAYQELLKRASSALGVRPEELSARDGIISAGSKSVSYADLVRDSQLDIEIPVQGLLEGLGITVLGTPPLLPISDYKIIGTSAPNPRVPTVVKGTVPWVADVTLPGMLHGRVVHPPTLGSTLVSAGSLDPGAFPNTQVVVKRNLVGVVSSDEWEAIRAAETLAQSTRWSQWSGLPGSDNLLEALLDTDWSQVAPGTWPADGSGAVEAEAALGSAAQTVSAMYTLPFYKHAPIGPEVTVADVRGDGTTHVWSFSQRLQTLRSKIAILLETDPANVIVHFREGPASFGRSTTGDGGAEAEAVILSQAVGRPVRVQWMKDDDFAWSVQHAPYLGELNVGLDANGRMTAFTAKHHLPGMNDGRMLGALLAGLPTESGPPHGAGPYLNWLAHHWPYDEVPHRFEQAYGAPNVGQPQSPIEIGLRHRSMRSPVGLQQNWSVECLISEAAAAAGADPIQFRIDHTGDDRLINVLETVREMSGWETRPSPAPGARASGGGIVRGRGLGLAIRNGSYFASVAEISVDLSSGQVGVDRYWIAVDAGLIVNPRQLTLNVEGGTAFGISETLHEELQFNRSAVTSTDYRSYRILAMAEMPELEVKLIECEDAKVAGQGAEPPNMLPPIAMAGAFFDATGKQIRRLPMKPEYVLAELRE
jgi:CO/xanthine dehydrogenase Mo-binding subunit